jgi:simple sugar transport system permease protein
VSTTTTTTKMSTTKARGFGIFFLLLAGLTLVFLTRSGDATFGLNEFGSGATVWTLPDLTVPVVPTVIVAAVAAAFAGGVQLTRGFGRRTLLVLGLVLGVFVFAFLTWATAGSSLNLLAILKLTIRGAVPLTFGALGGVLCERAGVMNIAIEAQFLTAAFTGALVGSVADNAWIGILAGALGGAFISWLLAVMAIKYRTDQIIVGVVLIVFATGLTSFLATQLLTPNPQLNSPAIVSPIAIPLLSDIPLLGPLLFNHTVFVYGAAAAVALTQWALFRTKWGLRVRSVGEKPRAADTVGVNVFRTRYQAVILGGVVAGLGGAFFTLDSAAQFSEQMTAGLGFISLAAMIVGRWRPIGALGAALIFGFAGSLSNGLALVDVPIPSEFLLMAPYVVTIVVVAGLVGRPRPPAADGQPYVKE